MEMLGMWIHCHRRSAPGEMPDLRRPGEQVRQGGGLSEEVNTMEQNLTTFEGVLDFAIRGEKDSAALYEELAGRAKNENMKRSLMQFAGEERGHQAKLESIKGGSTALPLETDITDLKIAGILVDVTPSEDMTYQEVLIFAMKKEKEAFILYTTLGDYTDDPVLKETFHALAQEEARHKLRFEMEYDDGVMTDN